MFRIGRLARRLLCLLILAYASVSAANGYGIDTVRPISEYRFDSWTVRDGLPSRPITAIAQTPDGFLWLATASGLLRFDGSSFDTYDTQNTPSLPVDDITALMVSREGTLWVGTEWGGFGTFSNGRYTPVAPRDKKWASIKAFAQDVDGSIWVGGWGATPIVRHIVNGVTKVYILRNTQDPGVNRLLPDGHGGVICGMPWDAPRLLRADGTYGPISSTYLGVGCSGLVRDRAGAIWYASETAGLFRLKNGIVRNWTVKDGLPSNHLTRLWLDNGDNVWIGTTNGICRWDGHRLEPFGKMQGLPHSLISAIVEDRESNLWVASGSVLSRLASTKLSPVDMSQGSDEAVVQQQGAIAASGHGNVWCATNNGIWRLNSQSITKIAVEKGVDLKPDGLVAASGNSLWVWGTPHQGSCWVWRLSTGPSDAGPLKITEGPFVTPAATTIWVGVARPGELIGFGSGNVYEIRPGQPVHVARFPGTFQFCAEQDRHGDIWIGDNVGIIRWCKGKATVYTDGLPPGVHVLSIDTSDPRCLWLATDHGLGRFQDGHCQLVGPQAGLPDSNILQILRDESGKLWLGSHFGIVSVRQRDVEDYLGGRTSKIAYQAFSSADGVRAFPDIFSRARSTDGRLWFGGSGGITMVNPSAFEYNPIPPPVAIESADIDGVALVPGKSIAIRPGVGRLTVHYAALSYAAPEKVRFRYRLAGLDTAWTEASSRRIATYPFLPPGNYRFEVVACNNDGVWNEAGTSVSFTLLPHYYQTVWFRILCLCAGILVLGLLYKLRMRQMVLRNQALEHKVAERTVELSEARDILTEQYEELEDRAVELETMQAELEAQNDELTKTQESLSEANTKLEQLATTDALTGLKNRRAFQERVDLEWAKARRSDGNLSLIVLDVDKFKHYNDTYGHAAGDDVLRTVGRILAECARDTDFVARYGGEEFVIVAIDADVDGGIAVAERFRAAIESVPWTMRSVTASFGVASIRPDVASPGDLFALADGALYASKEAGRNRVTHCVNVADDNAADAMSTAA